MHQQHFLSTAMARLARPLCAAWISIASVPFVASAQVRDVPDNIVRSTAALNQSQIETVKKTVDALMDPANWADEKKIRRTRDDVLKPLLDPQVSAPFRLDYSKLLEPHLVRLSTGAAPKDEIAVVNALLIAGELATDPAIAIIEKQLASKSITVRYAAVKGLTLTLESLTRHSPAIMQERAEHIVAALGKQLATETDPRVADAAARGLIAGMSVTRQGFETVRPKSVSELAIRLGARLKAQAGKSIDEMLVETAVQSGTAIRDALANTGQAGQLQASVKIDAAGLAGDMIVYVARLVKAGNDLPVVAADDGPDQVGQKAKVRDGARQMVQLAEVVLSFAGEKGAVKIPPLAELLKSAKAADDAKFLDNAAQVLGPNGLLQKPPFGFPDNRFEFK